MKNHVLLTTTSSLDGWEILEYLGPVSAQFVIGTGLFTDFFASWTDFFGAHSRSYQEKLDRIHREALDQITQRAQRLGASVVLGLRVDHDEIAGNGKSMLMVTASGTAARARRVTVGSPPPTHADRVLLAAEDMRILIETEEVVGLARAGKLTWSSEREWAFIIEHRVEDLAEAVVAQVDDALNMGYSLDGDLAKQVFERYFMAIPGDVALPILYACVVDRPQLSEMALRHIERLDGFDPVRTLALIRGDDDSVARRAVSMIRAERSAYSAEDLPVLRELADALEARFAQLPIVEVKGVFGSKRTWRCTCGHQVEEGTERCQACTRDRRGFNERVLNSDAASTLLRTRIRLLEQRLGEIGMA